MVKKRKTIRNKKGSIQDLMFIAVVLLVFAVVTLIMFKISSELNDKFSENEAIQKYDIDSKGRNAMDNINNMYSGVIDNSFLLLMIGLVISALAFAMMVRVHPVFFIFFLIVLVIMIFLSGVFSNIYMEMANNAEMIGVASQLTFITKTMKALPFIVGVMGFILAIIMFKTGRR